MLPTITCLTAVLETTCCTVVAKFSSTTIASAPESLRRSIWESIDLSETSNEMSDTIIRAQSPSPSCNPLNRSRPNWSFCQSTAILRSG